MSYSPEDQGRTQAEKREQPPAIGSVHHSETQGGAWSITTARTGARDTSDDSFRDDHHVFDADASTGDFAPTPGRTPPTPVSAAYGPPSGARAPADSNILSGTPPGTPPHGRHDQYDLITFRSVCLGIGHFLAHPVSSIFLRHVFPLIDRVLQAELLTHTYPSKRTRHDTIFSSFVLWPINR